VRLARRPREDQLASPRAEVRAAALRNISGTVQVLACSSTSDQRMLSVSLRRVPSRRRSSLFLRCVSWNSAQLQIRNQQVLGSISSAGSMSPGHMQRLVTSGLQEGRLCVAAGLEHGPVHSIRVVFV